MPKSLQQSGEPEEILFPLEAYKTLEGLRDKVLDTPRGYFEVRNLERPYWGPGGPPERLRVELMPLDEIEAAPDAQDWREYREVVKLDELPKIFRTW